MRSAVLAIALMTLVLAGCGDDEPQRIALPEHVGVDLEVTKPLTRGATVEITNGTKDPLTIERGTVRAFGAEAALRGGPVTARKVQTKAIGVTLPRARCAAATTVQVELVYRIDGGGLKRSVTTAGVDPSAVKRLVDTDCFRSAVPVKVLDVDTHGDRGRRIDVTVDVGPAPDLASPELTVESLLGLKIPADLTWRVGAERSRHTVHAEVRCHLWKSSFGDAMGPSLEAAVPRGSAKADLPYTASQRAVVVASIDRVCGDS